ncbi:vacuole protein [Gyrodon lividus]|nr:vacuole protein [Gyrodon lividus]
MSTVEDGADSVTDTLLRGFFMIIFSEIGDKTFLIAAILAMRHPRVVVFAGAFGSLLLMSLLSAEMGHLLPSLIPKQWIQIAAGVLFLVFGSKMMMEGREMEGGSDKMQEEMREAAEEIEGDDAETDGTGDLVPNGHSIPLERLEEGKARHLTYTQNSTKKSKFVEGARNFCNLLLGPVFVQAFVLTFLGEWGDRSQFATIAMGATHNVYLVTLGTVIGHACCTILAVLGGRYVSTKISVKHVTLWGATLFLIFGVIYLYTSLAVSAEELPILIASDQVSGI